MMITQKEKKHTSPLSLLALAGLGVAMPLLDLLGGYPQFFVARGQRGLEVFTFALVAAGFIPLVALVLSWIARLGGERGKRITHQVLMFLLGTAMALSIFRKLPLQSDMLIWLLALLASASISVVEQQWDAFRKMLAVLSPTALVALGLFTFLSPSARLIWRADPGATPLPGIGRPAPVIIIFFDEFPLATLLNQDGRINATRFPNFARLAEASYWFRNASSVAPFTGGSIASALSGNLPEHEAPTAVDYPNNLFTLLGDSYRMHVHEEITQLCPETFCISSQDTIPATGRQTSEYLKAAWLDALVIYAHATLPPKLRAQLPALSHSWAGFWEWENISAAQQPTPEEDEDVVPLPIQRRTTHAQAAILEHFIAGIMPSLEPTLHFIHVVLPHFPWEMTPNGHTYQSESRLYDDLQAIPGLQSEGDQWGSNAFLVRQGIQRHTLQVGYVDFLIGKLIDQLQANGLWEDSVLVIIADHGVAFLPSHPRREPTPDTLAEIYRVPLFIKLPQQTDGEIRDDNALTMDLLPTLIDVLEVESNWFFEGRSLFGETSAPKMKLVVGGPEDHIPVSLDGLLAIAQRNAKIFNLREDWLGVASVGEYGKLVGEPIEDIGDNWQMATNWEVDQALDLQTVDFSSGHVPILLTGSIQEQSKTLHPEMLIVVNGVVAGIGEEFECQDKRCRFSAILAEEILKEGENTIEILHPSP